MGLQFVILNFQLPIPNYQCSITKAQLSMLNYQFSITREEVSLYGTPKEEVPPASSTSRSVGSSNLEPLFGEKNQFPFLSFEKQSRKGFILRPNWAAQRNLISLLSSRSILFKSNWCSCDTNLTL